MLILANRQDGQNPAGSAFSELENVGMLAIFRTSKFKILILTSHTTLYNGYVIKSEIISLISLK